MVKIVPQGSGSLREWVNTGTFEHAVSWLDAPHLMEVWELRDAVSAEKQVPAGVGNEPAEGACLAPPGTYLVRPCVPHVGGNGRVSGVAPSGDFTSLTLSWFLCLAV